MEACGPWSATWASGRGTRATRRARRSAGRPVRWRTRSRNARAAWCDRSAVGNRVMAHDLVIEIENNPGALARVAAAISDAGVNIAAATCTEPGARAELHILVPHPEAAKHALAISQLAVNREREVVVVNVEDRPGVLADLTRKIA